MSCASTRNKDGCFPTNGQSTDSILAMLNQRLASMEASLDEIAKNTSAGAESMQRMKEQNLASWGKANEVLNASIKYVTDGDGSHMKALEHTMQVQMQPLTSALENIQKQTVLLEHALDTVNPTTPRNSLSVQARVNQAISTMNPLQQGMRLKKTEYEVSLDNNASDRGKDLREGSSQELLQYEFASLKKAIKDQQDAVVQEISKVMQESYASPKFGASGAKVGGGRVAPRTPAPNPVPPLQVDAVPPDSVSVKVVPISAQRKELRDVAKSRDKTADDGIPRDNQANSKEHLKHTANLITTKMSSHQDLFDRQAGPSKVENDNDDVPLREMMPSQQSLATSTSSKCENDYELTLMEDTSLRSVFFHVTDLKTPAYHVQTFYKKTGIAQEWAQSEWLATTTMFMVLLNAIWIGIDSSEESTTNTYDSAWWILLATQIFIIFFTFEWLVRFLAFEHKSDAFKDGWFRFDTFLVVTMVLDTWVLELVLKILQMLSTGPDTKIHVPTQPFRMLRLLKLTRMARLMRTFPELVTLVKGLVRSLRAIASTCMMLLLLNYLWAIFLHTLLKDKHAFNAKVKLWLNSDFSSLPRCMWILVMNGTLLLDNSSPLMTEMVFTDDFAILFCGAMFVAFVFLTAILILQMLIGVLCDLVAKVNHEQADAEAIGLVKQELSAWLEEMADKNGYIPQSEFRDIMHKHKARRVLRKMDVNEIFLLQMEEMMYARKQEKVHITDALQLLLMCRSNNHATVETLAAGFSFLVKEIMVTRDHITNTLEEELPKVLTDKLG